jgi:folate-binding protein YgfZ
MADIALLPHRGAVSVEGEDRVAFLQGLVSADVREAAASRALWSALLTPQGRFLFEFFIFSDGARLVLECERARAAELAQRLLRFRLRAKVTVADISDGVVVAAGWGGAPIPPGLAAADGRVEGAGWRGVFPSDAAPEATAAWEAWDAHRLALGLADGSRDLEVEKTLLLEAWFDPLGGVSWTKGCYMGQELTARTKYRGLVKRRLVAVDVTGPLPGPGTAVFDGEAEVGTLRSGRGQRALAMLRTEVLGAPALRCGEATLRPVLLPWMAATEEAAQ